MELYKKLPVQNFNLQQFYGQKFLKLRYVYTISVVAKEPTTVNTEIFVGD